MHDTTFDERVAACENARVSAQRALASALRELLDNDAPISESMLRDRWLLQYREESTIYPIGYYEPPPSGFIVVFGTDTEPGNLNADNFRREATWPHDDVYLDREHGVMLLYASPVDRDTGMIGDFQVTLYLGHNPEVKDHLAHGLAATFQVYQEAQVGMRLMDVAERAAAIMAESHADGGTLSVTSGVINIGHTIPGVRGWTPEQWSVFQSGDWEAIKTAICKGRKWVSTDELMPIDPQTAFTLEARPQLPSRPDLPAASFHTIAVFNNGEKRLITGFRELFELVGMDYMPKL